MARFIFLAILATTLALVSGDASGESEFTSYVSMSERISIPNVKVPWSQLPGDFVKKEDVFLKTCSLNKTHMEPDKMNVRIDSPAMEQINQVITDLNSLVKNYEIAHNKGIYDNADKDIKSIKSFAARLRDIDRNKDKKSNKMGDEGPLILSICRDMHSIMGLILVSKKSTESVPSSSSEYAPFISKSKRVHDPKVTIPQNDMSKIYADKRSEFLEKCHDTKQGINDMKTLKLDQNGEAMKQINAALKDINAASHAFAKNFKIKQFNFEMFQIEMMKLQAIRDRLFAIDKKLPEPRKVNHEGSLIVEICSDMYSLMSLMVGSQRNEPKMSQIKPPLWSSLQHTENSIIGPIRA